MIHSIADFFMVFGIYKDTVGVEYGFLPKPRLEMITHPLRAELRGTFVAV